MGAPQQEPWTNTSVALQEFGNESRSSMEGNNSGPMVRKYILLLRSQTAAQWPDIDATWLATTVAM